ncbi:MAG: HypC/HybG/HupF family hydrogenase formation chaperone [Solirubrobacteraceae bacterium]
MRVLHVDSERGLAECADDSGARSAAVEIGLVAPVAPGDVVLVHAGTALTRLDEEVAV